VEWRLDWSENFAGSNFSPRPKKRHLVKPTVVVEFWGYLQRSGAAFTLAPLLPLAYVARDGRSNLG